MEIETAKLMGLQTASEITVGTIRIVSQVRVTVNSLNSR